MSQAKKTSDKNKKTPSVPNNEEKHREEDSSPPKDEKKSKSINFLLFEFFVMG